MAVMLATIKRLLTRPAPTGIVGTTDATESPVVFGSSKVSSLVCSGQSNEGHIEDFSVDYGECSRDDPTRYPCDRIPADLLHQRYLDFCREWALQPMSDVAFFRRIKAAGFERFREPTGARRWFYRFA